MKFIKKNFTNLLFIVGIVLLLVPQTRMPITVFIQQMISFSPSEISVDKRQSLEDYNWNLVDLEGNKVNLKQSKQRVVLINFWATWCPPCVAEMPELQELYDNYKGQVDFYFVSTENKEKLQLFLDKKEYSLPVYIQKAM